MMWHHSSLKTSNICIVGTSATLCQDVGLWVRFRCSCTSNLIKLAETVSSILCECVTGYIMHVVIPPPHTHTHTLRCLTSACGRRTAPRLDRVGGTANGVTPTETERGDTEENTRTTTTHVTSHTHKAQTIRQHAHIFLHNIFLGLPLLHIQT